MTLLDFTKELLTELSKYNLQAHGKVAASVEISQIIKGLYERAVEEDAKSSVESSEPLKGEVL